MTKQKIVIKVCMPCDKCRSKAMEVVAKADGLISVAITGEEKLEVIGDDIDIACLVKCLRKKVAYAKILQVEEVKDKKPEEKKPEEKKEKKPEEPKPCTCPAPCPVPCWCAAGYALPPTKLVCYEEPPACHIQ